MKNLRILILGFGMLSCALVSSSQAPIPNITDNRLDFTVTGLQGDSITLSSFKGKILLLDFWASWCKPCRFANKDLLILYSKYKNNGLEILSVSIDEESKKWKKAVSKDKLTWIQGIDSEAGSAVKWQVDGLPSTYLVNKDGNVVAINLELEELEKKIKELLDL